MDAGEKATGTYSGKIQLWWHGDLQTEIPATMTVIGAGDILTSKKSVAFGDEYVGNSYDSIIQIKNNGVLPVSTTALDSDNPVFSTSARAPLNIAPGEGINATIRFSPTIVSAQSGRITIISDDPDEGTYVISLSGNGVGPPILTSTPTQLTASVFTNESQTQNLTIVNSGGSVLKWRIIGESNPYPLSINGPVEPLASGDFTSFGPTQEKLMSPTIDPISGLIYAQSPYNQHVDVYNPITHGWSEEPGTSLSNNSTSGGAVILKSKMYAVYPENNSKIGVY